MGREKKKQVAVFQMSWKVNLKLILPERSFNVVREMFLRVKNGGL